MASFSRKSGIVGALVIAGVLVVGAVILSGPVLSFFTPAANAESTQALLQAYAKKDTDGDGLPDWQEALYGTDPNNAHSISATLTDGQEVSQGLIKPKFSLATPTTASSSIETDLPGTAPAAGSLTDQFAQQFFSEYMTQQSQNTDGTQPSDADIDTYAESAMQDFIASQTQQDPYTQANVKTSGSGSTALASYAAATQAIFAANTVPTAESGIEYFSDAVEKNDTSALTNISMIGKEYTAIGKGLLAMQVPTEAQYAHLEMVNALTRLGVDFSNMATLQTDPLRAYVGFSSYQTDGASLQQGFIDMKSVFTTEKFTLNPGDPGYDFYSTTADAASQ